jgi:long-chain acyl-CoA synthetase
VEPSDLCTVIYTSGTTGPPKGVMLDHANVVWTGESLLRAIGQSLAGWRQISYLPMAHIAERMTGHYNHIRTGSVVTCCPDTAQFAAYLVAVRPNFLFGVPRIWEKLHAGVMAGVAREADPERKAAIEKALEVGRRVAELQVAGQEVPSDLAAAHRRLDEAVLATLRALVGLDDCRIAVTGAAPISTEVLWFFRAIGVNLSEIYGMSESTGPITWDPYAVRVGTVGRALPGVSVKLADDGEVCFKGGNAFRGYLKDPEKTAEMIDAEGWYHTGDIGVLDDDGYLRIVDRKKELIITAGGKNISPANIESALKSQPLIGQACVVGDGRKFVAALLVLDPDVAPAWAKARGIEFASIADLATHEAVLAEVQREVDAANARFSSVEQVKRFTVLATEWLPDSEELTPTMKLKRRGILSKYAAEIEAMYAGA